MESIVLDLIKNIYFALAFGALTSSVIFIYAKEKVIFTINKESPLPKATFAIIGVAILTFFISLIAFEITTPKQALLVSFGIVSFIANNKEDDLAKALQEQS